jgi:membrane-bound lytic murein transglycosylase A
MVAQDTGSAIVGPARADIYFGAGADAGRVSGRLRNNARFVMLVPKSLDPMARGRRMPLPDVRPSQKIARLFPQVDPLKGQQKDQRQKDQNNAAKAPEASAAAGSKDTSRDTGKDIAKDTAKPVESAKNPAPATTQPPPPAVVAQASAPVAAAKPVPLPEARPSIKPVREMRRHRHYHDGQYLRVR